MPVSRYLVLLLSVFLVCSDILLAADSEKTPNVVFILTDNHGAWTLGCYGNPEIRTPNIDRLAAEGTLMEQAYSSNPVCSPTRATFLTGLMPSQHGVHCFLRGGRLQIGPDARNTLEQFQSIPEILKSKGYRCGLVGKWHLGDNLQPQEGLDDYWITMPHGGTNTFYDAKIIEDGQQRSESKYLTEFWTDHAVKFIEQKDERPFFLYLAYNGPYALGRLLLDEGRNRHVESYRNMELTSFPDEPTHPWQFNNLDYFHNPISNRRVAAEVSGVDDGVGRVMLALKANGLDENTIVVFAADQGWAGGHGGYYGMGDHTRPVTATDEMMKIPMVWRHPGGIEEGQRSGVMVSNYDFMPTLIGYLGFAESIKNDPPLAGRDYSAVLKGEKIKDWVQEVFYEFEFLRTIRTDEWKLTRRYPDGPDELFNLKDDPSEQNNVYNRKSGEQQRGLQDRLNHYFDKNSLPEYDLLNDGGSQTVLFNPPVPKEKILHDKVNRIDNFDKSEQIKVPEGYIVDKVASSMLVQHPMMAGFDDRGRLFVAESAGMNLRNDDLEEQLPNSIKMLEDLDQDGIFDKSTVFADKMTLPMGACWYRDALYVASPPHIWKLQDTDDDGVADVRTKLPAKFGYNGNAASVHGCFLSPEGRIYWCDGRHGHELEDAEGNVTSKRSGSYIFSAWPDGSDLQIHSGGGMDNPVEVDFTDSGDVLGTVNILYSGPRSDCLVHWLHGGAYPHSQRVLGELPRTGDLLGPVHQFGHVGVSGTNRYRSGVLDRNFRDNMFVTIFNTGQLVRIELDKKGSTYQSKQHEFLTCSDPDFHPTDVLEDADGSLLLVDTGGWFRIGCPTSQIAKPDIKGGIYRIRKEGMPEWTDPRGLQVDWKNLSNRELIFMCMDTRFTVRERAIDECALRGDSLLPDIKTWIVRGDIPIRLNLVWACTRMRNNAAAQECVRLALNDRDETVRAAACKSVGVTKDVLAIEGLVASLNDESFHVRRAALTALGQIGEQAAITAILKHASSLQDRSEDHALIYALMQINAPDEISKGLGSDHVETRRVALIALDQIAPESLSSETVLNLIAKGGNSKIIEAALNVLHHHPDWSSDVANLIDSWISGQIPISNEDATALLAAFATSPNLIPTLHNALQLHESDQEQFLAAMRGIEQSNLKSVPDGLAGSWMKAVHSNDEAISRAAIKALAGRQHSFSSELQLIAESTKLSTTIRLSAIAAIPEELTSEEIVYFLISVIENGTPPTDVEQAISLLERVRLTGNSMDQVVELVATAGPLELQGLLKVFSDVKEEETLKELAATLVIARSRKTLALPRLNQSSKQWSKGAKEALQPLLAELQTIESQQLEKLERLEPLTKHASVNRGEDVFFSEKAKCATCHRVGEKGGKIGPDLSAIGLIRRERDLLEAILFPSNSFAREYEPYSVVTDDGKIYSGLISHETETSIFLQQATGEPTEVQREKIDTIVPAAVSVMPQGLETGLNESQLADLVAFLRAQNQPLQKE